MKNNFNFLYFSLLVFSLSLSSCGQNVKENEKQIVSVSFDITEERSIPDIDPMTSLGNYGPQTSDQQYKNTKENKSLLGVIIGPGLYKSILGLYAIDCLERYDKKISVVSGIGFGSIVAALYAQGDKVETIKWKLYKHMRDGASKLPYKDDWRKHWIKFIDNNLSERKIKLSSISLWLPSYYKEKNKVKFSSKGEVVETIKNSIDERREDFILKNKYVTLENIEKLPVDKIILSSVIGNKINIKNSYLFDMYSKTKSVLDELDKTSNTKLKIMNIETDDSIDSIQFTETLGREFCTRVVEAIK